MAYAFNVGPLDDPYIGALEWGGYVWTNTGTFHAPVHITYFLDNTNSTWTSVESNAYAAALQSWANVANITISAASSAGSADLIGHSVPESVLGAGTYGMHGTPEDAAQSSDQYEDGILVGGRSYAHGYFNFEGFGWDYADPNGGLRVGGNGYWTLIHELGHGLGLAHPHDDGGGSSLFPGVTSSSSTGDNGLNQGIWSVMSYNAFQDRGTANTNHSANSLWYDSAGNAVGNYGYYAGPMAFDIAAIQDLYGANLNYQTGSNNYVLPDVNGGGTYWTCIWDAGGTDSISYGGSRNVTIDLRAATLDNTSTGGGVISGADGIMGGYTIANGVVIENANGGNGNDTLRGNSAANILNGGAGADTMAGGNGADTYVVDNAGDVVNEVGDGTVDQVNVYNLTSYTLGANLENLNFLGSPTTARTGYGNSLNNLIQTYHGDDILDGRAGADTMQGYSGNDTYYVDNVGDVILESANGGNDWAYVSLTSYTLGANVENLNYIGTNTNNFTGYGNELDNTILGWSGNDILDGRAGADTMRGYSGNDTFYVDNAGDVVIENVGEGLDWVEVSLSTYTLGANVENLDYNGPNTSGFTGYGNELDNVIQGWNGDDVLDGRAGADTMRGYNGNDTFYVDNVGDIIAEFANGGTDMVAAAVSYTLAAGQSVEALYLSDVVAVTALNLVGNELAQTLTGNAGNNILVGGRGADTLYGLGGNDTYSVDNAGDLVFETAGGGTDRVSAAVSYTLAAGQSIESLYLTDAAGVTALNLVGNELVQSLTGNAGNNILVGGGGADTMRGLGGNDTYSVDNSGDLVFETAGGGTDRVSAAVSYTLGAGQSIEELYFTNAASVTALNLVGNDLGQTLSGNAGNNLLDGKDGFDTLRGYGGNDSFQFSTALGAGNVDHIADFSAVDDTIRLRQSVFSDLGLGTLTSTAYKDIASGAVDANDRILYDHNTGYLYYDADGSGAGVRTMFAILDNKPATLTHVDFLVVA